MSAELITLEVASVNSKNMATVIDQMFKPTSMYGVRANQNPTNSITITEAGDTQSVLSAWALTKETGMVVYEGLVLYWALTSSSTTRTIKLYRGSNKSLLIASGSAVITDGSSGTIFLTGSNDNTYTGSVLLTIGGGGITDDTDIANILTYSNVTAANDLQVDGETEFLYIENREVKTKYTVSDTVAEIQAMIDGTS